MPPKRSRTAAGSSQPTPEPQKPVRASTRKRRASDASSVSERPGSSQGPAASGLAAPAKRRKTKKGRTAASEEPEVIIEEEEVEGAHVTDAAPVNATPLEEVVEEGDEGLNGDANDMSKQSRHVHFGSDDTADKSTATHKTPHTSKMTVKRRVTLSPNAGGGSKRYRTITHRTSLPAILSQEDSEPVHTVQEHQFAALRDVLDDRIRRRLRRSHLSEEQNALEYHEKRDGRTQKELEELRHETMEKEKRIKELMLELESQRQFGIEVHDETQSEQERIRAVEAELAALRKEVLANRGRGYTDRTPDEDMMVIDSQEEVSYPQLPNDLQPPQTPSADAKRTPTRYSQQLTVTGNNRMSLSTPGNKYWEAERRRFEDSILALSKEANEATANLQILTIELQSLGFSQTDVSVTEVVQSIRDSFDSIRERLDLLLPGSVPEDASNEEILEILFANVKEFADRLRIQDKEHHQQVALSMDLRVQVDKLIDHLAAAEIRIRNLEQQWRELDETSEEKEREIDELEQQLLAAEEERDGLQTELTETRRQVTEFGSENTDLQHAVERLTVSLQGYRDEETKLQNLITKMEEEHGAIIAKMNQEREEAVDDLESRLFTESTLRREAEKQADDRQVVITELEIRIEQVSTLRDGLTDELAKTKNDLVVEREAREQAESGAAEKDIQVEDLETRVNNLENELDTLSTQLEELRGLNESERRQREAAETDLDDRNVEIEGLNQKLREQGMEANGLRQKMFEVQQQNLARVNELQKLASDQDAQYQRDIAQEVERREDAEETTRIRDATILELQNTLDETEQRMRDLLAERDARIAQLEDEVSDKNAEIVRLQDSLYSTQTALSTETAQSQQRRGELEASIASLQDTITVHEDTIRTLEREAVETVALHNSEMEDRNSAIASLNHNIALLHTQVSELETVKAGLERRVEAEAEQMLQLSSEKEDEIDSLRNTIRDKQAKILIVEEKAVEADRRWQEVLDARDEEIRILRTETEINTTAIEEMSVQRDSLKKRFQAYIRRSSSVVKNLQEELARAKAVADAEGDGLKDEGADLLEELEAMDEVTEMASKKTVVQSSSSKKMAGKGRKKRVYDSGFGVASDELDGESMAAL